VTCERQVSRQRTKAASPLRVSCLVPAARPCNRGRLFEHREHRHHDLISSLPEGGAVEVPCLVDCNGIQPTRIGALPPQLAAMMRLIKRCDSSSGMSKAVRVPGCGVLLARVPAPDRGYALPMAPAIPQAQPARR